MRPEDIVNRQRRLESEREIIKEKWEVIERYICPYRGRFYYDDTSAGETSQEWRKPWIYDGTAINASQNLASSLHSALTSPTTRFYLLKFRDPAIKDNQEAQEWLAECADIIYWSLQDSNFNVQINETYQDLVNYGTSILIEELGKDEELVFKSIPIKECFFEEDDKDGILNFYRVYDWKPNQMLSFFGEDGLPDEIVEEAKDPTTDTAKKYKIIYCVYARPDKAHNLRSDAATLPEKERPFGYKYVLVNESTVLGEPGGFFEMPAYIPRWRKTNGSAWGNSPAMVAIADTLTLNRLMELNLVAIEKVIDPPTLTTQRGLIGDLNLKAGGITVVRSLDDVRTYESGARFDVTYEEMGRLRESIKDYFFINQLLLPPMGKTPATATEISVRMQQLERLIGPTLGRLNTDLLDPMIERSFRLLARANKLPAMPESLTGVSLDYDIEYVSPMAKTQEASNVAAIERFLMTAAQLAQVKPDLVDVPDFDECLRLMASGMGVPPKGLNSTDDVDDKREARKAQEEQMQKAMLMEQTGKGIQAMEGDQGGAQ